MPVRTNWREIVLFVLPEKTSALTMMNSEMLQATLLGYKMWIAGAPRRL
jgi:hypothetical protein